MAVAKCFSRYFGRHGYISASKEISSQNAFWVFVCLYNALFSKVGNRFVFIYYLVICT